MIEKQESYQKDHDWKSEEKNKLFTSDSWEKRELEKEREIAKMIHKEVTGHDKREMKSHIDEFPSTKLSREADVCSEAGLANKSRFVIQLTENEDSSQDKSQSKPCEALDPLALGSLQMKGQTASKPRKKRRPQSLNLGLPPELIYQEGDSDSAEEIKTSASDSSPDENIAATGNNFQSSGVVLIKEEHGSEENQACKMRKGSKQEDLLSGDGRHVSAPRVEQVKRKESYMESDMDLGSVNGPGKNIHDGSSAGVKGESVVRVRGKGLIDNKELAEVKLRHVRTHERRISSSGGEDMEGFMGDRVHKASLHRLSGSSYQSEITRILPLKPERSKSVACKDEKDRTGPDEASRALRRDYRWSVGSPEGHSELNWADVSSFHPGVVEGIAKQELQDDSYQSSRGSTESQWFSSKGSCLPKMAPPAPPVKTQKARESGLILRNSRNAGRDPSLETAKKRHSVTARLLLFSHWKIKHRMSFRQPRTPFSFFSRVFSDLKTLIHHTCLNRQSHTVAPPFGQNIHFKVWTFFQMANLHSSSHKNRRISVVLSSPFSNLRPKLSSSSEGDSKRTAFTLSQFGCFLEFSVPFTLWKYKTNHSKQEGETVLVIHLLS